LTLTLRQALPLWRKEEAMRRWKVGELARATGVTVRTLHHYDRIGLLAASCRSDAGYRQYTEPDIARLQQILSLRRLGFSLLEIGECLAGQRFTPLRVVEMHLGRLQEQIAAQNRLRARLAALAERLRAAENVSADEFIQTLETMTMVESYYTPEQLQALEARRAALGEERINEVQAEWPRLMEEVRAEMERGTDPSDERVQALARRWTGLVREFTGGDPAMERSVGRIYREQPKVHGMETGPVREMMEYLSRAAPQAPQT
jgi:DNA-binding transcriptional MerR regulator